MEINDAPFYVKEQLLQLIGSRTPSFEQVWAKFGRQIEENGLGHYSKVVLMTAQKVA